MGEVCAPLSMGNLFVYTRAYVLRFGDHDALFRSLLALQLRCRRRQRQRRRRRFDCVRDLGGVLGSVPVGQRASVVRPRVQELGGVMILLV